MKAINRIKQYIDYKGFSNSYFEKKNNLSNGYIATQIKRNADLGESILLKILDNSLDIDPIWLLTGKGNMLKDNVDMEILHESYECDKYAILLIELRKELEESKELIKEKDKTISQLVALLSSKTTTK